MGFFKSFALRVHAEKLARGFGNVRSQYFDFIMREIQTKLGTEAAQDHVTLGGDADYALRGFQLWLYFFFSMVHPYVSENDREDLFRYVAAMLTGSSMNEVGAYYRKSVDLSNNYVDLVGAVAFPVAQGIMQDLDPSAAAITATLLPFLAINTQIVIAGEFRDKITADRLSSQMRIKYETMESGATVTAPMFCFNCGCSFDSETRCCLLCGVPLVLVGPGCDPQFAPESGNSEKESERQQTDPAPAPEPRKVEAASTDIPIEMIEKGTDFRHNHFKGISDWEDRMFAEFGEKVVPLLAMIWNRTS